ncbi:MAG: hypothetical protein IT365_27915 [Candidatus Hydrogenedentes bacterium]|nr:hypothetical protein [Candidatus Hydrogenedentota bacterium]
MGRLFTVSIPLIASFCAAYAVADEVEDAIPRSLRYLEKGAIDWKDTMGCASCHHAPMMLWTCATAKRQGYEVDNASVETIAKYLLSEDNAAKILPPENPPPERDGTQLGSTYALLALEQSGAARADAAVVKRIRDHFIATQREDGTWPPFPSMGRSPILEGIAVSARMLTLALADLPEGAAIPAVVQKAYAALATPIENPSHQVRVLQLLVDVRSDAPHDVIDAQVNALESLQRPDGSWAQTPEMSGDAYATGQTLYALGKAGKRADNPVVRRAVAFLLSTQQPEGSWPMTSRPMAEGDSGSTNLEPITFAATAWAILGILAVTESP